MAAADPQALADRLFSTFLAPLVLGGPTRPGKPIGGKRILSIGDRAPSDAATLSLVDLARVRVARRIVAVDRLESAPTGTEWALAGVLHDLVQSTHPGFAAPLRRSGPPRLLDVVEKTLDALPGATHARDALSRHTWLARMFELARTDTDLKWWTGSERFLGTEPPARLQAWPELRRVQVTKTARPLMDLPSSGGVADPSRFAHLVSRLLEKSPLTDLATIDRPLPAFVWTRETLTLCATNAGRTLALRAFALLPEREVDAALGRATRQLFALKAVRARRFAMAVLRDRALASAAVRISGANEPEALVLGETRDDAAFAIATGALVATHWIAQSGVGLTERDRRAMLEVLAPAARGTTPSTVADLGASLPPPAALRPM